MEGKRFTIRPQSKARLARNTRTAAANLIRRAIKKPRKKAFSVSKLTSQVKQLKVTQRGSLQMDRQYMSWTSPDDPPHPAPYYFDARSPSVLRPIAFLHQAISVGSVSHTCRFSPPIPPLTTKNLDRTIAGRWVTQTYPPVADYAVNPNGLAFDQIRYWDQSRGVGNDYLHMSTHYQLSIQAVNCRGYFDIFLVHPKKPFLRSTIQDISLPDGIQGFTNLSLGSGHQYTLNNQYWTQKRIKRKYFNTAAPAGLPSAGGRPGYLQTNPDLDCEFTVKNVKSRQHIKAPELFEGGVLDATDITFSKQDWIIISCTIENEDIDVDHGLKFAIYRTPIWRDRDGAST